MGLELHITQFSIAELEEMLLDVGPKSTILFYSLIYMNLIYNFVF